MHIWIQAALERHDAFPSDSIFKPSLRSNSDIVSDSFAIDKRLKDPRATVFIADLAARSRQ